MKYLCWLVLIVFSLALIDCRGDKNKSKETVNTDTIKYPVYEDYKPDERDSMKRVEELLDSNKVDNNEVVLVEDKKGNLKPQNETQNQSGDVYIIVGSFKNYNNALKVSNHYKSQGYNPQILPKYNEYNRVAIVSYTDVKVAREELKKLRKKHNKPSFWLLKRQ